MSIGIAAFALLASTVPPTDSVPWATSAAATPAEVEAPALRVAADGVEPYLLSFTDDVAGTISSGPLRDTPLPPGADEIRVWVGFGILSPESMIRVWRTSAGHADGEVWLYADRVEEDEYARFADYDCAEERRDDGVWACRVDVAPRPDWARVRASLIAADIATLHDESKIPESKLRVHDGVAMVAEVRAGGAWRAWSFSNPHLRDDPYGDAAARVMDVANELEPAPPGN